MKSVTVSTFPPSICHEVIGPDAMILVFQCVRIPVSVLSKLSCPSPETGLKGFFSDSACCSWGLPKAIFNVAFQVPFK